MNKYNVLVKKYAWMFMGVDPRYPFPMFGFECDAGWYDLLADLLKKIDAYAEKNPDVKKDFRVLQITEKFGRLRFYATYSVPEIDELIDEAEDLSGITCEHCGKPGKLRGTSWYYTLCDKCWQMR